ncbi:S-layer homology domain-containing protein [Peptoniphilus asaccharolyticus DSM 20463]|uniref:S-layer homology domain-containing protein n=1 Tax=Peptoniphilus asaccharolyticus DSM 20463 TaxID=573058 RepID=A0A1W1VK93_PEPAS|nr:S-layer homology domain-containing protein [Peptoniphilus asaccharolyticus]MBL7574453.1 GA module-containing protein [Peptoniphilus asaccharolyticus]SMB93799.1 S-layer homology domain-containing protein [Peptoniphilus asaccharolyticus DSM 20463]
MTIRQQEKEDFKNHINEAKDEESINKIVEKAREESNENKKKEAEKKAKEEAKKRAEDALNSSDNLTNKEKEDFKKQIDDPNKTAEDLDKLANEILKKNEENKEKLQDAKNKAKDEINKNKYLTEDEKNNFKKKIDEAKDEQAINKVVDDAKAKNLEKAKEKAIETINKLKEVDETEKDNAKTKVTTATTVEDVEKALADIQAKDANKKAEKDKAEANALKDKYKKEIENIPGLDEAKKKEYQDMIDEAKSKDEMDSILDFAKADAKRKDGKDKIDALTHLNNKQKEEFKSQIDNVAPTQIDDIVAEATKTDTKMETLQKLVEKANGADVQNAKNKTTDQTKKDAFEKALEDAKKVTDKENGNSASGPQVDKLIENLKKAIADLGANADVTTSKTELEKAIEEAEKVKGTSKYTNATDTLKKDFDKKLEKAKQLKDDQAAKQDAIDRAVDELQEAQNKLDGIFDLELKDDKAVYIKTEPTVGTVITDTDDQKKIEDKIKDIPTGATINHKAVVDEGGVKKAVVEIVVGRDKKEIKVPVKKDAKEPTIEIVKGSTTVTKLDDRFPTIRITAKDNESGLDGDLEFEGVPDYLEFNKQQNKFIFKTGITQIPKTASTFTIKVKAKDKAGNTKEESIKITVQSQKDKYPAKPKENKFTKNTGDSTGNASDYVFVSETTNFPQGTTFKWLENGKEEDDITLDKDGDKIEKTVLVKYPDDSTAEVKVIFNVSKTTLGDPTAVEKLNSDLEITPGPNATSLLIKYTDNAGMEQSVTLTKAGEDWNGLIKGVTEKDGKITLSHELTKETSTVKVQAKADNYNDSQEVSFNLTKARAKSPIKPVKIKGEIKVGEELAAQDETLVLNSLTNENLNGGQASIERGVTVRKDGDKNVIDVRITYKDFSQSKITVPIVQDNSVPIINFKGVTDDKVSIAKYEKFAGIEIEATDDGAELAGDKITVEGLPDYMEYNQTSKKIVIKDSEKYKRIPENAKIGDITVTVSAKDDMDNLTKKTLTIKIEKEKDVLETKNPIQIDGSDKVGEALSPGDSTKVANSIKPQEANVKITLQNDGKIMDLGGKSVVKVKLDYDDGFSRTIFVEVEQKAKDKYGYNLPDSDDKVKVNDDKNLTKEEKEKVKDKIKEKNPDITDDSHNIEVGDDGSVKITSKDGKDERDKKPKIPGDKVVEQSNALEKEVNIPTTKVKVKDASKLDDSEKAKVKKALEDANNFETGTNIDIKGDGTAVITFPDASTKTIEGKKLVESDSITGTIASKTKINIPAEKTKVVNKNKISEDEREEIRQKLADANKDLPQGTRIVVNNDGSAKVIYSDDSITSIPADKLVELKAQEETLANKNPANKPADKVKVEDTTKLTQEEKDVVKDAVKKENPNAKDIIVGADGTTTLVYEDKSENVIPGKDLVEAKDPNKKPDSIASQNPAVIPKEKTKVLDLNNLNDDEIAEVTSKIRKENEKAIDVIVSKTGNATLKYEDGSENTIPSTELVEKFVSKADQANIENPDKKVVVKDSNRLSDEEKKEVEKNIRDKNNNLDDTVKVEVDNDGNANIIFDDGSTKSIDKNNLVEQDQNINQKPNPTIADNTDIVIPENRIRVNNIVSLTLEEKAKVEEAIKKANEGKLTGATIEVLGDGTVIITYTDNSIDQVPGHKLVMVDKNGTDPEILVLPELPLVEDLKDPAKDRIKEKADEEKSEIANSPYINDNTKKELEKKVQDTVDDILKKIEEATKPEDVIKVIDEGLKEIENIYHLVKPEEPSEPSEPEEPSDGYFGYNPFFRIFNDSTNTTKNDKKVETKIVNSYIVGYSDNTFKADKSITRAEAVVMLARLEGLALNDMSNNIFKDTKENWYLPYLNALYNKGMIEEKIGENFRPNEAMTRAEFAKMISYIDKKNDAKAPFKDIIGHKYEAAINQAFGNGRIKGYPNGKFKPDGKITRAEIVTILNNLYGRKTTANSLKDVKVEGFKDLKESHWAYYDIIDAAYTHQVKVDKGNEVEQWIRIIK